MEQPDQLTDTHERSNSSMLDADWLKQLALDSGADDAGLVSKDANAASYRLSNESRADSQSGSISCKSGVSFDWRACKRSLSHHRPVSGEARHPSYQSAHGIPNGDSILAGKDVGRFT